MTEQPNETAVEFIRKLQGRLAQAASGIEETVTLVEKVGNRVVEFIDGYNAALETQVEEYLTKVSDDYPPTNEPPKSDRSVWEEVVDSVNKTKGTHRSPVSREDKIEEIKSALRGVLKGKAGVWENNDFLKGLDESYIETVYQSIKNWKNKQ